MFAARMITEGEYRAALAESPNIAGLERKVEKTMAAPPPEEKPPVPLPSIGPGLLEPPPPAKGPDSSPTEDPEPPLSPETVETPPPEEPEGPAMPTR
jgi:hypothetical protein